MVNLEALYKERGFTAKPKTAGELGGPCPFCGGKDRFCIFPRQGRDGLGRFWCRQCGKSGDAIQFLRDMEGLSFREAQRALGLPELSPAPRQTHLAPPPAPEFTPCQAPLPGPQWQEIAGRLVEWASGQLEREPKIITWLERERGLSLATIRRARLGWIPQDYYRPREKYGLAPELKPNGRPRRVWIPKGLLIPVFNAGGQLMRVKFRVFGAGETRPKYIPLPQAEKNTAPLVIQGKGVAAWQIVESELDGLLMHQEAGQLVNVAALGSAAFRPDADTWAKLRTARKILISLDFDDAGNKAACQWWQKHLKPGQFKIWPVPEGKDPTDAFKAGWNLSEWARAGLNF